MLTHGHPRPLLQSGWLPEQRTIINRYHSLLIGNSITLATPHREPPAMPLWYHFVSRILERAIKITDATCVPWPLTSTPWRKSTIASQCKSHAFILPIWICKTVKCKSSTRRFGKIYWTHWLYNPTWRVHRNPPTTNGISAIEVA